MRFATITADPPWPYEQRDVTGSRQPKVNGELDSGVSSTRRYGAMSVGDLCAMPVERYAETNAHLYLWTTNSFLVEAHQIAREWGFEPKTMITWTKTRLEDGQPSMKTGYYYRGATEHCLFCIRGSLRLSGPARPTAFLHPRLPHSVKPDAFFALMEEQSPGPRLELFSRRKRPGWSCWGNQVESDVALTVEDVI